MEVADGISINTDPPIYTCEVRTREEGGYKKEKETLREKEKKL